MPEYFVDIADETGSVSAGALGELERAAAWVLRAEGVAGDAQISVALVRDETIARLNTDYLAHVGPTDVISFPMESVGNRVVGDIYVGVEQAARQAAELGVEAGAELLRLTIHGILHVLGWDHPEEEGREDSPMFRRQEELLSEFLESER